MPVQYRQYIGDGFRRIIESIVMQGLYPSLQSFLARLILGMLIIFFFAKINIKPKTIFPIVPVFMHALPSIQIKPLFFTAPQNVAILSSNA